MPTQEDLTTYHLEVIEEIDFSVTFLYNDMFGEPINLAGYTASMECRQGQSGIYSGYDNPDVVIRIDQTSGIDLSVNGQVTLNIAASFTHALTWNRGVYSIVLITLTGQRIMFAHGFFTVIANATKAY
jgi:hypothetical protein